MPAARPPSSLWPAIAMALIFANNMAGTTLPAPLYPIYQDTLGFSNLMVTVIFAVYALGVLVALVATGPWSDQIGRRPILFAGLGLSALSAVLFFVGGGLWPLLLGRVLSGLSAGLFTATATIAVIELAPKERQSLAALAATAANMGGLGLGPLLAGTLSQWLPWPLHLVYAVHLVLTLAAGLVLWRLPETVTRPARRRLHRQSLGLPPQVRGVFVPAAIASFAGFAVLGLFTSLAPSIMGQLLGMKNHAVVGSVVFLVFAASLGGQVLQRRLPENSRLPMACGALMIGVACLGASIATASLAPLIVATLAAGAGQGAIFAASIGAITQASPIHKRAEVTALLFVVAYLAISVPVVSLGVAVEYLDLHTAGLLFTGVILLLSATALITLARKKRMAPVSR